MVKENMEKKTNDPFGRIFDEFSQEFEEMQRTMDSVVRGAVPSEGTTVYGPQYYGFSMTIGPDGKPIVREFGNLRQQGKAQLPVGTREPLVDTVVDPKKSIVRIAAEMPGVTKEDIEVSATEKTVTISAERGEKRYQTEVQLPAEVVPESTQATYNNGILELTMKTKGPAKAKGFDIKVK